MKLTVTNNHVAFKIQEDRSNSKDLRKDIIFKNRRKFIEKSHMSLKDLKQLILERPMEITPSPLPDFVGSSVFISPNLKLSLILKKAPERHIVEAWDIPSLIDKEIVCTSEKELIGITNSLMFDLDLTDESDVSIGALRKYHIYHVTMMSRLYSRWNTPMYLEIYGEVLEYGGLQEDMKRFMHKNSGSIDLSKEVPGPLKIKIKSARWSNLSNPTGVFYM